MTRPLVIPRESHEPLRQAIAPCLSYFNSAADVEGFVVVALGAGAFEVRTDMDPASAREWLLAVAAEMGEARE